MDWIRLLIAGLLEIAWAFGLKYSDGFTDPWPSVLTIAGILTSFFFFSEAMKRIPVGTAYAVFTGIGSFGAALIGMLFLDEGASPLKVFFLLLLIVGIIGLKFSTKDETSDAKGEG